MIGVVGEASIADVEVRYLEIERDGEPWFYSAGAPVADEWCYIADARLLEELEPGTAAILIDAVTRGIFFRCAALLGIPWTDDMVPLLDTQMHAGMELLARAPEMARRDPEELRRIRDSA